MRQRHRAPIKGLAEKVAATTAPPPNPNKIPFLVVLSARAYAGMGHVYAGTVPAAVVARRRAKNKRARIARRAGRS